MELDDIKLQLEVQYYRHKLDAGIEEFFDRLNERIQEKGFYARAKLTVELMNISRRNRFNDYWLQRKIRQLKGAEHFEYRVFKKSGFALRRLAGLKKK